MREHKFRRLLKMECCKAMSSPFFLAVLAAGMLFAVLAALYNIGAYRTWMDNVRITGGNPMQQAASLYNHWIGGEAQSLGYTLFYTLLPLLAVFPYRWSYCTERKAGYTRMVVIRGGKRQYFLAKYIAAFLSGGAAVLLPLLINLAATACFVPAVKPFVSYMLYYGMAHGSMWSGLYYEHPLVFVLLYLLLDFLFAGLFAVTALGLSVYVRNQAAAVLLPYLGVLCLHYARTLLYYRVYIEISPLHFLHASCVENSVSWAVVLAEGVILFLFSAGSMWKAGAVDEVW